MSDKDQIGTGSTRENGAPNESDRNSLSVGPNGPLLLHDTHLLDTLAHFNRESVPERRPHAKGSGAFGEFRVTADMSRYTKAAVFQPGAVTKMLARFSTVAGELGSPDTWRDVRGFALKFYTTEGNFDIVGNNTPVFFVRDPMKFPHFIHSQKRLPDSALRDETMQWDFWVNNPESAHQVTYLMGDRGRPKSWRHMNGYGSHTYMWINDAGDRFWVKYHFISQQGVENLSDDEAIELAGSDPDHHREDLFNAIKNGDYPSWRLEVQIMPYEDAKNYRFNPFDLTKVWSKKDYPRMEVGVMTLNENPTNHHAQIEQASFAPSNFVPGTGFSPDKMLLGRVFAYADAARYRIGPNFDQLPVNQPLPEVAAKANRYTIGGPMEYHHSGDKPTYAPNSYGRPHADQTGRDEASWESDGDLVRSAYELHEQDDDFGQAGALVREVLDDAGRERLVQNIVNHISNVTDDDVLERVFDYWTSVDADLGREVREQMK